MRCRHIRSFLVGLFSHPRWWEALACYPLGMSTWAGCAMPLWILQHRQADAHVLGEIATCLVELHHATTCVKDTLGGSFSNPNHHIQGKKKNKTTMGKMSNLPCFEAFFKVPQKEGGKISSIKFSFSGHFRSLFGHLFLMLLSLFSSLFAKLLLPDSFCGTLNSGSHFVQTSLRA